MWGKVGESVCIGYFRGDAGGCPLEAIGEGEANRVIYFGNDLYFPQRIPATPQYNLRHSETQ